MISFKVPATTANLGPGFDTMGLALELFNENDKVETEQKVTVGNLLYEDTLKMNMKY